MPLYIFKTYYFLGITGSSWLSGHTSRAVHDKVDNRLWVLVIITWATLATNRISTWRRCLNKKKRANSRVFQIFASGHFEEYIIRY